MPCPICDQKPANCDCTETERRQYCEIEELRDEIAGLREAIRRHAEQNATLSVCDGNVTVTMDATLTDDERVAITVLLDRLRATDAIDVELAAILRGLLERLK